MDGRGVAAEDEIDGLLLRADDVRKAAPSRSDVEVVRARLGELLGRARSLLPDVRDERRRLDLAGSIARRFADLDRDELADKLEPTPGVAPAPTSVDDPTRVPPGQHLTPGWPVLHVGRAPSFDPDRWRFTVTGRVRKRIVLSWNDMRALPQLTVTRDFHCVTGWSRLDNTWTGVRVSEVLARVDPAPTATHAIVTGHPGYAANLALDVLAQADVLFAWAHDGVALPRAHGGPLRLVVPNRYGWKSVKWAFELRLTDRDVHGYWEERGYHDEGDPFREQRFRGDE